MKITNNSNLIGIFVLKFIIKSECDSLGTNVTCQQCLKKFEKCFWCNSDNTCKNLKFDGIFPSGCKASHARWISCGRRKKFS